MKRHALFVGVDTYADGHIPNLSCAVSDATDLHGFFKYGAGYDRVELLPNPAGKKEVLGMVQELTSDLNSGDFFLFFFAGHGFRVGENHVLVCAKDLYEDVKYEDDGLPLGQLKRRLSGAFDSALLLDACQSDILATRGGEGIAERDLSLIHEAPPVRAGGGTLTIVTSCDAGQTAAELSEGRHGLFTMAMLNLLKEAQRTHVRLDLSDAFRMNLGRRMGEIAANVGFRTEQRPRFSCTGDSCFVLLDGIASVPAVQAALPMSALPHAAAPASAGECVEEGVAFVEKSTKLRGVMQFDSGYLSKYFITDRKPMECELEDPYILILDGGISDVQAMRSFMTGVEKTGRPLLVVAEDVGDEVLKMLVEKKLRGACCVCAVRAPEDCRTEFLEDVAVVTGGKFFSKDLNIRLQDIQIEWLGRAKKVVVARDGTIVIGGRGSPQNIKERVEMIKWQIDEAVSGDDRDRLRERISKFSCEEYGAAQRLYIQAEKYYRGQNFAKAFEFYQKAAKKGEAEATYSLGRMFEKGEGAAKNNEKALFWYRRAAELGSENAERAIKGQEERLKNELEVKALQDGADAQYHLGKRFYDGDGVERDYKEAFKWYRKAAESGHADAQCGIAGMYECGEGVEEDYAEAARWYQMALENGHAEAKDSLCEMYYNLGEKYYYGEDADEDYEESVKWYLKAAELGHADAQYSLGLCYENGDGVDQNYVEALTWYLKAAVQEHDEAREALRKLLSEMHESEDDADLAKEWCANILEEDDEADVGIIETIKSEIAEENSKDEEDEVLGSRDNGACNETGVCRTLALPGGAKMEMVYCPPGEFTMGDLEWEEREADEEKPHRVRLTRGFWLGKYPVTQAQWKSVMGNNPSYFMDDDRPVEQVTWNESQEFIQKVNDWSNCAARLPTEAEWEYACRAGTSGDFGGAGILDEMGWYDDNSGGETHPVGQKKPNAWGLYDMHGNVGEWCNDWHGDYPSCDVTDPAGPESGDSRVFRGGSWEDDELTCCSSSRNGLPPNALDYGKGNHGFRLCCSVVPQDKNTVVIHISTRSNDQNSMQSLYEQAENYYRGQKGVREDRVKAFELYQKAAEQGHPEAQYSLGYMYAYGECTAKDEEKALFWYRKAAAQGHEKAGRMATGLEQRVNSCSGAGRSDRTRTQSVSVEEAYEKGENFYYGRNGFAQSYADAVSWYRFAAWQGHVWAQYSLGYCYQYGQGVARDEAEAVKWFRKSAEAGNAAAQCSLGSCYYNGQGVARNFAEAVKWYRCAVAQENAYAEGNFGLCYENGQGVTQDYSEAANLYRKAIANGNERAKESLERVEQKIAASLKTKTIRIPRDLVPTTSASGDCDEIKSAVVLDDCGSNKIAVIQEIRAIKGMGLAEAKKLVESSPVAIIRDVAMSECRRIAQRLEKAGARVHYTVASSPTRTLGNILRDARLAKGYYSIEQLAAKAKIPTEFARDLENDDFHCIATPIYGRGFVKLYAECVGLDPAPLVEMFMAEYNAQKF